MRCAARLTPLSEPPPCGSRSLVLASRTMPITPASPQRKPPDDLVGLVGQLHAKAREHGDENAIAAAAKAHEHAQAGDIEKVKLHTERLTTIAALAPLANAILTAIASVGA